MFNFFEIRQGALQSKPLLCLLHFSLGSTLLPAWSSNSVLGQIDTFDNDPLLPLESLASASLIRMIAELCDLLILEFKIFNRLCNN